MKEEYIIISKTAIEKRIEELKKVINKHVGHAEQEIYDSLDYLISQSTPLIPEIEKQSIGFAKSLLNNTVNRAKSIENIEEYYPKEYQLLLGELELNGKSIFEDYVLNLKLDI